MYILKDKILLKHVSPLNYIISIEFEKNPVKNC